ncbi:MAG: hypothetical protein WD851_06695 [Pirellulales bacterium]
MAVCLAAALASSHAMVGQMSAAAASGDSSSTPVEELRHEANASGRTTKILVQLTKPLPTFEIPRTSGRQDATQAQERSSDRFPLSGGQHALRNGLGAPLLT